MAVTTLRRVYVWEWPVRVYHWINAGSIIILCITGYIIGNPPAFIMAKEASFSYWFGWVRFIHFAASYIFLFNFIVRIYWGFVGNKYAKWYEFLPVSKKFMKEMWRVLRMDILFLKGKEKLQVGHNALAGFSYFLTFIAFLLQVITGFGLYAAMSDAFIPQLFTWVPDLVGGDFALRHIHHITMWFFIIFAMVHVHLVIFHDVVEGRGETSSMVSGWKFIEEESLALEEEEEKQKIEQKKKLKNIIKKVFPIKDKEADD